ncbi:S-adenosylhomocysteine hydrolase [Paraburkholderia steynii]|uniref:S-adenosylhomocysteine hydrolase n=1 Tax=Paraburkholderia steynii TaxID=1245441 RepID=A0A4R0XMD0_9BURK|nr:S-adenosylhomocysteine hydrolase [Paraburkholderia steynii]
MYLEDRLKISIAKQASDVFLRTDFARFGSEAQVSRALRKLVETGVIVKLGVGVYARAKRSALSGVPIPVQPVEILAEKALARMGVKVYPSRQVELYNSGRTTQLPAGVVINTGRRRIGRKLGFGKKTVQYENHLRRTERTY